MLSLSLAWGTQPAIRGDTRRRRPNAYRSCPGNLNILQTTHHPWFTAKHHHQQSIINYGDPSPTMAIHHQLWTTKWTTTIPLGLIFFFFFFCLLLLLYVIIINNKRWYLHSPVAGPRNLHGQQTWADCRRLGQSWRTRRGMRVLPPCASSM